MKHARLTGGLLLSLLSVVAVSILAGCVEEGPPPPPGMVVVGYDYYYYPNDEVYFYPETGVYFWFVGDGWHSGRHLPQGYAVHDEGRVNVHLNTRRPYEQHEQIHAQYPRHGGGTPRPEGGEHGPR